MNDMKMLCPKVVPFSGLKKMNGNSLHGRLPKGGGGGGGGEGESYI